MVVGISASCVGLRAMLMYVSDVDIIRMDIYASCVGIMGVEWNTCCRVLCIVCWDNDGRLVYWLLICLYRVLE